MLDLMATLWEAFRSLLKGYGQALEPFPRPARTWPGEMMALERDLNRLQQDARSVLSSLR